ncbi:hypothetical protein Aph02nite_67000 [Actinoplanes philippinensis]|uniref:Oxygen sensor histidine kinase NreB n=1 Tax=Actinoplanes philippinensis TaxID=35752 RepID=A0A1I2L4D6_9ACTN|nr:ATP-binding protein [Actinoplanes philippinensis]GIE80750.1 hypothetical protein Aph02nite_67000 [Actinoplanes philippinensis]SFF71986.1 Histidine kinase-, DNA gyrase B-, and HSP90-like ATPase [Actinoplanes philippinensis]
MWRNVLAKALALASVIGALVTLADLFVNQKVHDPGLGPSGLAALARLATVAPVLFFATAGTVMVTRSPRNPLTWLVLGIGVTLSGWEWYDTEVARCSMPGPSRQHALAAVLYGTVALGVPIVILARYPDGRLPARLRHWPFAAGYAGAVVLVLRDLGPLDACGRWAFAHQGAAQPVMVSAVVAVTAGAVLSRRRSVARRRRPLAWVIGCGLISCAFQIHHHGQVPGQNSHDMLSLLAHPLVVVPLAAAYGRARPDRVQVRAVVRRTVVYGTVSSLVLVVHSAGARIYEGVWRPAQFAVALTLTVVLVAAWDHLQHAANYLAYGIRRDPLRTLADLRAGVASGTDSDLLPTAVRTVVAAVRAQGAVLVLPDGTVSVRAGDEPDDRYVTFPLRYGGTKVGELRVACRNRETRYSRIEVELLEALAAQVAVLVKATELGEALEAERARVLAATRDERDRLRRDLHDGLGPSLAGMGLGLRALSSLVDDDTPEAEMVGRLREATDLAVGDIRRIIDALRPTVLDAENLVGAVERHAVALRSALAVELTAGTLPALGPDVEVAAYRIVTEALTNAARHARAERAWIHITANDVLHISVRDNGLGIRNEAPRHGVGLVSMRRRAELLGGGFSVHSTGSGTTVTATLPLRNS